MICYHLILNLTLNYFLLPKLPSISNLNKCNKINESIFSETNCTSIVLWNNPNTIGSTLGLSKFTKYIKNITT